jgi:hypothetical protein
MGWKHAAIGLTLATVVVVQGGAPVHVQGQVQGNLKSFMRQKLDHSQRILEGLTVEDYAMIAQGARALEELSRDARWQVSPNINYLRMSSEFQDQAAELAAKAKQRNLDGASLAYVRMTLNCVKCHQYTRDNRLTRRDPAPGLKRY